MGGGFKATNLAMKSFKGRDTLYCLFRLITGLNQSWWTQQRILYDNLEVNGMRSLVQLLCFCPASNQWVRPSDGNLKQEQLQTLYLFCQRTHTWRETGQHAKVEVSAASWKHIFRLQEKRYFPPKKRFCTVLQQLKAWLVQHATYFTWPYFTVSHSQLRLHTMCYKS